MKESDPNIGTLIARRKLNDWLRNGEANHELNLEGLDLFEFPLETKHLKELRYINLSNNRLTDLPDTWRELSNLRKLKLSNNAFTSLPEPVCELKSLRELDLSSNLLTSFEGELEGLHLLHSLDLSKNNLSKLPINISELTTLLTLDVSRNSIGSLPATIGLLQELKHLNLSNNRLISLATEIGQLARLQQLNVSNNMLRAIPTQIGKLLLLSELYLEDNRLETLPAIISNFGQLTSLSVSRNQLLNLPDQIGRMHSLTKLEAADNRLENLPDEIGELTNLRSLHLERNKLTSIPGAVGRLTKLEQLSLHENQLATLPPQTGQLNSLETLRLERNQLTSLPQSIRRLLGLKHLFLHGNPELKLPPSVLGSAIERSRGWGGEYPPAKPSDVLDYYFDTRGIRGQALREVKVILVGRGEVGKTSMVEVLRGKKFVKNRRRTDGISITPWNIKLKDGGAEIVFWDFGGQEIMHGTHQFFLTHRSLYIIMIDGRHDRARADAEYWLKISRAFGGESTVMVVMNRQKEHPFDLDREALSRKYGVKLEHFFRTDCEHPSSIMPLRTAIRDESVRMLAAEERFPARCWKVKTRLAEMRSYGEDYLSESDYQALCEKHGVKNETEQTKLLRRLADLGTVVSFPDDVRMSALSVLNPAWATDGIYRVITNESLRESKHGLLTIDELRKLLPRSRWPQSIHIQYVLDLMRKFDLCFPVDYSDREFLIPELLEDRSPPLGSWNPAHCLVFQYQYSVLPHGVIPRLITRTHLQSKKCPRWRTGVVLVDESAEARIQADYDANTISIWVRGPDAHSRRSILKMVRHNCESIHSKIEGLNPQEFIAIPNHPHTLGRV